MRFVNIKDIRTFEPGGVIEPFWESLKSNDIEFTAKVVDTDALKELLETTLAGEKRVEWRIAS